MYDDIWNSLPKYTCGNRTVCAMKIAQMESGDSINEHRGEELLPAGSMVLMSEDFGEPSIFVSSEVMLKCQFAVGGWYVLTEGDEDNHEEQFWSNDLFESTYVLAETHG